MAPCSVVARRYPRPTSVAGAPAGGEWTPLVAVLLGGGGRDSEHPSLPRLPVPGPLCPAFDVAEDHHGATDLLRAGPAELRALQARRGFDRDVAQRLVVLSYLTQWALPRVKTGAEFERELQRLSAHDSAGVSQAARALLLAWREQAVAA